MVFFTCDTCGSSLKKNQVEKHYNSQCRRSAALTCMDCQKEFPGDSYKTHTSCISEAEKYSAKGWQPKANANKGLKKQNAWIESIQEAVEQLGSDMDKDVKSLLDGIMAFDNIPRKKPKFVNFVKNVVGGGKRCSPATIEKTWSIFEAEIKKKQDNSTSSTAMAQIEVENINTVEVNQGVVMFSGTKKHRQDMSKGKKKKFDWESAVSRVLARTSDQAGAGYKMKKLKKKLIKMYSYQFTDIDPEKVKARVSKRLSKLQSKYSVSD